MYITHEAKTYFFWLIFRIMIITIRSQITTAIVMKFPLGRSHPVTKVDIHMCICIQKHRYFTYVNLNICTCMNIDTYIWIIEFMSFYICTFVYVIIHLFKQLFTYLYSIHIWIINSHLWYKQFCIFFILCVYRCIFFFLLIRI